MKNTSFNAAVCLIGFIILLVHIVNILIKRNRKKDENILLAFLVFTAFHFALYFAFTIIKTAYSDNAIIMGFYTAFYIANNLEVFFLFLYMVNYVDLPGKTKKTMQIGNILLFSVFVLLDLINLFTPIFFYADNGVYVRAKGMIISQGYQFVMLAIVFLTVIFNKHLNRREKIAFSSYCILPLVAIIFQNIFPGYAIAYLSIIITTEILFFYLYVERSHELIREEEKSKDAQIRVMLSQIQPHFIYNSLSSISTLIEIDPPLAQKTLNDFTDYLRLNLSSLTEKGLTPFGEELRHIETYLSLEKIRFDERVNVVYDIEARDFDVPPLSIQPLVENAVKHGILKRVEGGTITLRTYENESGIVVEVIDDGVGFSMEDVDFESNEHIGLSNIRYRISTMCDGELIVDSEPGKGAKVTLIFKK